MLQRRQLKPECRDKTLAEHSIWAFPRPMRAIPPIAQAPNSNQKDQAQGVLVV